MFAETGASSRKPYRKMFDSVVDLNRDINHWKNFSNIYHSIYWFRETEEKVNRTGPDYETAIINRVVLDLDSYKKTRKDGVLYEWYNKKGLEDIRKVEDWAEKRQLLRQFRFCYSDDTEILTKDRGWILFEDLTMEDEVACLSRSDHVMYWHKPSAIQKYHYEGEMINIDHRSLNLLITPNHNLYVRINNRKNYELLRADKCVYSNQHTINSVNWIGKTIDTILGYDANTFIKLIGWFVSDGWCLTGKNRRFYRVGIKQQKEKNFDDITNCLDKLGLKWWRTGGSFCFSNKKIWNYFVKLGKSYEKYIPKNVLESSKEQLTILFESLMKGDGWYGKYGDIGYSTTSKKLANQFQELVIKIGMNSTLFVRDRIGEMHKIREEKITTKRISYEINIRKRKECNFKKHHNKKVNYESTVYCCTVPEHIILIRRNGRPSWQGNSGGGFYFIFSAIGHPLKLRDFEINLHNDLGVDIDVATIGDTSRMMRVTNSFNFKEHRKAYCIPISKEELYLPYEKIKKIAQKPRNERFIYGTETHDFSSCKIDKEKIKLKKLKVNLSKAKGLEADDVLVNYGWKVEHFCDTIKGIISLSHVGNALRFELLKYLKTIVKLSAEDAVRVLVALLGSEGIHSAIEGQAKYVYGYNKRFNPKWKLKQLGYCDPDCSFCNDYKKLVYNVIKNGY